MDKEIKKEQQDTAISIEQMEDVTGGLIIKNDLLSDHPDEKRLDKLPLGSEKISFGDLARNSDQNQADSAIADFLS